MKLFSLHSWRQDQLLKRVMRNSSYLFVSNVIGAVLSIVAANLLGVTGFGVLGGLTGFVSGVNRLFSFRMGDVVVRYMGEALARGESDRAGAVVKAAMLVEALTSLLAFAFLAFISPWAAASVLKDPTAAPLLLLYGISILANIITETSTGVLQVTNHYRSQALVNLVQSILVAGLMGLAVVIRADLRFVLWAYLIGKIILGIGPVLLAFYWLPSVLGKSWLSAPFSLLPPRRELLSFAVSTNFSGTINQIARDSEVTWVIYFFGPTAAGYFKTALAIINLVVMPITPFINTTYPEITRAFASHSWGRLRTLLRQVTLIAAGWTGAAALGLILLGRPLLFQTWMVFGRSFYVYRPEYLPALSVLMVLLVGFGTANILFWNRPLLLAQGLAGYPLKINFWVMVVKVALGFILIKGLGMGYLTEAALLSGYLAVSVGLIAWRGLREISAAQARTVSEQPAAVLD